MESPPSSPKSCFSVQPAAGASSTLPFSQPTFPCSHDRWWPSVSGMTVSSGRPVSRVLLLLILSLLTTHASAALITSFTNCLPEDVQQSPIHLQFHPLAVDAIFNLGGFPYQLNITVYGNVTGRSSDDPPGTKSDLTARSSTGGEEGWELVGGQYDDDGVRTARRRGIGFVESVEVPATKHQMLVGGVHRGLGHRIHKRRDIQYETMGKIIRVDSTWNKQTTLYSKVDVLTFQLLGAPAAFCSPDAVCPMSATSLRFVVM